MMFLALIIANGMFGMMLAQIAGGRWLREAIGRHQQGRAQWWGRPATRR